MKKYIRATAALSALVCGVSLLAFVPEALALAAPFTRGDNVVREVCINGKTVKMLGKAFEEAAKQNPGSTTGPCVVTPT